VKRRNLHLANQTAMDDLTAAFVTMGGPNGWYSTLTSWAERGYPTGGSTNGGGSGTISKPTERIALSGLDELAALAKRADELARQIRTAARALNAIRLATVNTAVYKEPEPVPCRNLNCPNIMERHKGESPRDGRCPRCATHHRRYNLEWPVKYVTSSTQT
jgi:hypothetical protein